MLNGGGNANSNNAELNECFKRNLELHDEIYRLPQFKRFRDRAIKKYSEKPKKDKKDKRDPNEEKVDNRRATAFNYYLCEVENLALTYIEKHLDERNIRIGTPCFDGCLIFQEDVKDLHDLLKQLEALLLEKMGYPVLMSEKKMDEDIDVSDLKIKEDLKTTDEDYATHLLEVLKDDMKYDSFSNELWFWSEEEALWRQQKPKHLRTLITKHLIPYINTSPDKEVIEEQTLLIKSDTKQSALVRMCEPYIEKRRDDTFISENFNRQKGLYPISDKQIVDFKTNTVRERVKTDYFTKTTTNKVVVVSKEERAEILKYYEDLLTTKEGKKSSEKHRDGLISIFAYGMTGENHLKKFINFIGERDGGKSLCVEHHNNILGEFGGSANERLFVAQKNKSCHDSELFNLRGKRLMSLTETSKDQKFNEDLIKKITGGDKVNIRGAGDKKTIDEKFDTLLILATNNMCDFSDEAFMSRLICYNFCNQFKKDASVPERLSQLRNQFFTILCEYAKMFYDNKRNIDWSEEAINYTKSICDEKDTVKVWIRDDLQFVVYDKENKEHDEKTFYLEKTQLYPKYCEFWAKTGKALEKKMEFYKSFEKHFNLPVGKKLTKNKQNFTGYEGIKLVVEEAPQDVEEEDQPKSFFSKPKSDLDAGL
jgi:phage/plasmid-associated DNA primase